MRSADNSVDINKGNHTNRGGRIADWQREMLPAHIVCSIADAINIAAAVINECISLYSGQESKPPSFRHNCIKFLFHSHIHR